MDQSSAPKIAGSWPARHRGLLISFGVLLAAFLLLPVPGFHDPNCTVLEDKRGKLLSARISADGQWRFPLCDSVPVKVESCICYFEDEYFRRHPGINPISLSKALLRNIRAGKVVSGGSTLSMQVVRLSRKGKPRTIGQKLVEIVLALRLETACSKDEILQLYASHAPFGGNVVGLDAASWRYFGRQAHQLSWGEAATLAVLPNAPSLIFPGRKQELLLAKRNRLLDKLYSKDVLDSLSCELAKDEALPGRPYPLPRLCPHLLERAVQDGHAGQRLTTSIDRQLQIRAMDLVERHHRQLVQNEIQNAALLILDIRSRSILAYVGNTPDAGEGSGSFVDITSAPRSSGSILKPLLYTLMLDEGSILPDMLVRDIPTQISGYTPKNFDHSYSGAVPASGALVRSLNIPAVRMLQKYGLEKFHSQLQELEFSTLSKGPDHYGLSLILGGGEVSLWDLCRVYLGMASTLNGNGSYEAPCYVAGTEYPRKETGQVMSAGAIWQCFETLTELERPTQEGSWERFSSAKTIAWKTGTSFGFRDAWAVGLTPDYLVGVWVGNADGEGRPGLTGINAAAPLMFEAFGLLPSSSWFDMPDEEMTGIRICSRSGYRAGPDCPDTEFQTVPENGVRIEACPYHRLVHLDAEGIHRVHSDCYSVADMTQEAWFVLPPVMEWYYKRKHPNYRSLPPWRTTCGGNDSQSMEMIYPRESSKIFIPRGLDGELSRVIFEVAHHDISTTIYWHLDDEYMGSTRAIHEMEIMPAEGYHILTLVDAAGNYLEKRFEVLGE